MILRYIIFPIGFLLFPPSNSQECSSTGTCWPSCQGADLPSSLAPSGSLGEVRIIIVVGIIINNRWCLYTTNVTIMFIREVYTSLINFVVIINSCDSMDWKRWQHQQNYFLKQKNTYQRNQHCQNHHSNCFGRSHLALCVPLRYPGDCSVHPPNSIGGTSKPG